MTTKADYEAGDWEKIARAPILAGLGITKADFGVVSAAKEFTAIIRGMGEAKAKYSANTLIQDVLAEPSDSGAGGSKGETPSLEAVLGSIKEAASVVERRAPAEEALEFKRFLLDIAQGAANASGQGFLGTGERISAKEADYLKRLQDHLGL
jgi:hypothetical protein